MSPDSERDISPGPDYQDEEMTIAPCHPPTQETTALAVEECVILATIITPTHLLCFGGFRQTADDPPKPWRLRAEALQRPGA